ncbi:hypothetical protein HPB49_026287 [Dermacentor silvarum]|nr:hypothetical protein HPB49_026287 [Dermacentor silvarum]
MFPPACTKFHLPHDSQVPQANQHIEDKARLYLQACLKVLNNSNIPNVKRILAKGGIVWPEENRRPDFLNALFFLSRYLFMPVLLHLSLSPSADGRTTLLHWTVREDYKKNMAALRTLGKMNHIRDHLRVTYEEFSGSPNETRLEEIMEHMEAFLAFLDKVEDAPETSVTFNKSDKFLQYAPSVSRQRWDSAFRQYVNGSIGSYGAVIVDDVAYFSAVFQLHQDYGEYIMNDIVETVSVQNLVAFTSADLLMSFSWGQRDTMIKSHIQNCFEYVYIIFGFAVNSQFMSHGLAHAQRHVRELGESLQSTFLSSLGDRPRNVSTRKENGSALKSKHVFDAVFELLIRSEPLEYPPAYRHYPNITDDPLENWLRLQGYYMGMTGSSDLYFIAYRTQEHVKFKNFRLMLHYLMFPFYADNVHDFYLPAHNKVNLQRSSREENGGGAANRRGSSDETEVKTISIPTAD